MSESEQIVYLLLSLNYTLGNGNKEIVGVFGSLDGAQSGHPYRDAQNNTLSLTWEELASGQYMAEVGNFGVTLFIQPTELKP